MNTLVKYLSLRFAICQALGSALGGGHGEADRPGPCLWGTHTGSGHLEASMADP